MHKPTRATAQPTRPESQAEAWVRPWQSLRKNTPSIRHRIGQGRRLLLAGTACAALAAFSSNASAELGWDSVPEEFFANDSFDVIEMDLAIRKGFTGRGAVIAVIDDGFAVPGAKFDLENDDFVFEIGLDVLDEDLRIDHPFFEGRVLEALDTARGGAPVPVDIHGTHVAGIAGSVSPGARLALYTYFGDAMNPDFGDAAAAFLAGARQGAVAYNNSWGADFDVNDILNDPAFAVDRFQALENVVGWGTAASWRKFVDAMRVAQETGVIVFAASNDFFLDDIDISAGMPLVFPDLRDAWIAVVNFAPGEGIVSVICGSAQAFCLAAPGQNEFIYDDDWDFGDDWDGDFILSDAGRASFSRINSTMPGGGFEEKSGTSMATPHVSGAIALGAEIFPDATPAQLAQLILQTAKDAGTPGIDPVYGWGILNVGNIVRTIDPGTAEIFANAAWSRFAALGHAGSVMRQRLAFRNATPSSNPAGAMRASNISLAFSSPENAIGRADTGGPSVWAAPLGGYAAIKAGSGSRGARSNTAGLLIGADLVSDAFARFGIAAGYSHTRLSTKGSADSGTSKAVHLGLYGSINSGNWFLQGSGQVAFFDQRLRRTAISGAMGTSGAPVGQSSFRGAALEVDARVGYGFELANGGRLSPYGAVNARWQHTHSFKEKGAGIFGLNGVSGSQRQFDFGPGLHWASAPIPVDGGNLRIETDIAYARLVGDLRNTTKVTLLGRGIKGSTAKLGRNVLRIGGQLTITGDKDQFSGFVGYGGSFQKGAVSHNLSAGLRINF